MLEPLFFKQLEISIQASFFIMAILFIRTCFKRMPKRYMCVLWGLVALRLICPVQITSSFSLVPDLSQVQMSIGSPNNVIANQESFTAGDMVKPEPNPQALTDRPVTPDKIPSSQVIFTEPTNPLTNDTVTTLVPTEADEETLKTTPLNISRLLAIIWCMGMVFFLGYGVISYLRTKHLLREAVHDTDNIWYCESIPSPFVIGYVKPRIYIPFSVTETELPYIIEHEKAHITHFDHLSKLLGYMLLCKYWFNPFIWVAYLFYCKDLELACDERVILKLGNAERKPYSQALLTCSVSNKALLRSPLAFSEVAIKERILSILSNKKLGFWGIILAGLACIIAVVCFLTSPETNDNKQNLHKINTFVSHLTPEELDTVTREYNHTYAEYNDADPYSLDGLYLLDNLEDEGVSLYGFSNYTAMLLKDGDSIYPVYISWPAPVSVTPRIFKGDYDKDGVAEYALYTLGSHGTNTEIYHLTILEVNDKELVGYTLEQTLIDEHLNTITYEYLPDDQGLSIRTVSTHTLLDVSRLEALYDTTMEHLLWGNYISFEERDGTWWMNARAGVAPHSTAVVDYEYGIIFSAPVIYSKDHTFKLDCFQIKAVNNLKEEDLLAIYAGHLETFPGKCSFDENGNLITTVNVTDYECAVTTSSITGETVYHWYEKPNHTPTPKTYPLEIKNGKIQEVPARIVTEKELLEYPYGKELIETTYRAYPYGIKQYILRENGTIHVNIGYEDETFLNLQCMTYKISKDKKTVSLLGCGSGYYLLQVNKVSGLKAFRDAFTGDGHILPNDTTQLPWEWLIALNEETYYKPMLHTSDVPVILHDYDFEQLAQYNLASSYNDFYAAEKRINHTYYTEFRYQDETDEIILLTDNNREIFSISLNGSDLPLPEHSRFLYYGNGGAYEVPHYADVTEDGIKELILCAGYRNYEDSYVYNIASMEQLLFDTNITEITSNISVTFEKADTKNNYLYYSIHYKDQSTDGKLYCNFNQEEIAALINGKDILSWASDYFTYTPTKDTTSIYYDAEKECFVSNIWLFVSNTFEQIFGNIYVDYIWDSKTNTFVPDLNSVSFLE